MLRQCEFESGSCNFPIRSPFFSVDLLKRVLKRPNGKTIVVEILSYSHRLNLFLEETLTKAAFMWSKIQ